MTKVLIIALLLALTGCQTMRSEPTCPFDAEGVGCKSPQDVYQMTNGRESLETQKGGSGKDAQKDASSLPGMAGRLLEPVVQPLPVLVPAEVVRIWVAPWIDARGDLNYPSYIFSEVTPRRWSFGENAGRDAQILTPLQVEAHAGDDGGYGGQPGGLVQGGASGKAPMPSIQTMDAPRQQSAPKTIGAMKTSPMPSPFGNQQ